MIVKEFRKYLLENDSICDLYRAKVASARTKSELMDLISDCNGIEFVTSKISEGVPLDYAECAAYFANHINGKRIFSHESGEGEYTTEIYCGYSGDIELRTTALALWGCNVDVSIGENSVAEINCDRNTKCRIKCPETSRIICVYWGDKPEILSGGHNVKFKKGE